MQKRILTISILTFSCYVCFSSIFFVVVSLKKTFYLICCYVQSSIYYHPLLSFDIFFFYKLPKKPVKIRLFGAFKHFHSFSFEHFFSPVFQHGKNIFNLRFLYALFVFYVLVVARYCAGCSLCRLIHIYVLSTFFKNIINSIIIVQQNIKQ